MTWLLNLVPFAGKALGILTKVLGALFLMRQGEKNQQLEDLKKNDENAKKASKTRSDIKSMSDDELDKLL